MNGGSEFCRVPRSTSLGWALEAGRLGEAISRRASFFWSPASRIAVDPGTSLCIARYRACASTSPAPCRSPQSHRCQRAPSESFRPAARVLGEAAPISEHHRAARALPRFGIYPFATTVCHLDVKEILAAAESAFKGRFPVLRIGAGTAGSEEKNFVFRHGAPLFLYTAV
jgi:hypothetical protein